MDQAPAPVRVSDVMTHDVIVIGADTPVHEVARILVEHGISGAPVVDRLQRVIGVVSQADICGRAGPWGLPLFALLRLADQRTPRVADHRTATDVMAPRVLTVTEAVPLSEAAAAMLERGINRLPVVDAHGRAVGIVTRSDIVRRFADIQPAG